MQVIGVVNLKPRNIAGVMSEVLLLGADTETENLSLLRPDRVTKIGQRIY